MAESTIPVLVVGAGPTGLTLAVELARRGAQCRIVEALPEPSPHTKATEIHARTLELLDQAELAEAFVAGGIVMKGAAFHSGGRCIAVLTNEGVECELPASLSFTQHDTERVLTTALIEHGGAVERGRAVVGLEQDPEAAVVTLQRGDGTTERVRAKWVVACDGAHSTLRESLGIALEGGEYPFILAGLNARVEGLPYPPDQYQVFLDETENWLGPIPGGWIRTSFKSEARTEHPTAEELQVVLDRHAGPGRTRVCEIADAAYFRLHHSVANTYRHGRVLLAGDAAHQSSPVGGTGMNTGIQDAFNLGWKLALITASAAAPSLVDSYEAERRPVAQATVKMTDDIINSWVFGDAAAVQTRDRQMAVQFSSPLARLAAVETGHGLRIDYRGSPLVAGHRSDRHSRGRHAVAWTGPAPGDRVYAPGPLVTADGTTTSLRQIRRGTAHQLFILAGEADADTVEAYAELAASAVARFRPWLAAHVLVVADRAPSAAAPGVTVLADPGFGVHGHLGAVADTLYLVRPDGYLGYRAEPPDSVRLAEYFAGLGIAVR